MMIRKGLWLIFIVNLCIILFFAVYFVKSANYEFVLYVGVMIFFLAIFVLTRDKVHFPDYVFWLLTLWGLMHMTGGSIHINGVLLYSVILMPLSKTAPIFRYDQLVHIVGFGAATLVMYYMLKPLLKSEINGWWSLSIVVLSAGLGVGAFNEMIEFIATVLVPETNVGGYLNTSLDLVSNFIGATAAVLFMRLRDALTPVSA